MSACFDHALARPGIVAIASDTLRCYSALPDDLFDYLQPPTRRAGRPPRHDFGNWTVADDWPERVPVSEVEIDIYEAWFGDLFDRIFGPCR